VDNIARVGLSGSGDENQMEKRLTSLRPITEHRNKIHNTKQKRDKTKVCALCGNVATQEAFFKVEGASLIEKYCDIWFC
jgi:hypothetical protein